MLERASIEAEYLDPVVERDLFQRWRQHGDQQAREKILRAYLRYALSKARKFARSDTTVEDLEQEATIGLLHAMDKYDPDSGNSFVTYAAYYILDRMGKYTLTTVSPLKVTTSNAPLRLLHKYHSTRRRIEAMAGRPMDAELRKQLMAELGVDAEALQSYETAITLPVFLDDDERREELIPGLSADTARRSENTLDYGQAMARVRQLLLELSHRDRHIFTSRTFGTGRANRASTLARKYKLTTEQVYEIEERVLTFLRGRLEEEGLTADFAS